MLALRNKARFDFQEGSFRARFVYSNEYSITHTTTISAIAYHMQTISIVTSATKDDRQQT
jgi:hypothetical protein